MTGLAAIIGDGHERNAPALAWGLRALGIAALASLVLAVFGIERTVRLEPSSIKHVAGHMYAVSLRPDAFYVLRVRGNNRLLPSWSTTRVSQRQRPLERTLCSDTRRIEEKGGRYAHCNDTLYFSAGAGADPRADTVRIHATYHVYVSLWFAALLSAAFAALLAAGGPAGDRGPLRSTVKARVERLFFGLPLGVLKICLLAALLVVLAALLASSSEVAYGLATGVRDVVRKLTIMAFSVAAAVLAAQVRFDDKGRAVRLLLQAIVLILLAAGIDKKFINFLSIACVFVGAAGTFVVMAKPRWKAWWQNLIDRWTPEDERDRAALARRTIALCTGLGLVYMAPELIRFWDQSGWMDSHRYDVLAHNIATGATPFADTTYMPIYQYGMAAFYWAFGHFYFVQQVVNLLLALLMIVFVASAAWVLFRSPVVVAIAGLFAVNWSQLHHATWYSQIEGWYVPIFAGSVLALVHYLQARDSRALVVLAIAAALVFNTRLQGAFYAAALGLAVFFIAEMTIRKRAQHLLLFAAVFFAVGILPWAARNYYVEGRFSPSSGQSNAFLALYNDPRVPLYGLRYWEIPPEVGQEWVEKYPDVKERQSAYRRYFLKRLVDDPGYFANAVPWRLMGFYGVLPKGASAPGGPKSTKLSEQDWSYLKTRPRFWAPILISLLGWIATFRSRLNLLFGGLIFSNILIGLIVGIPEPRLCYPVFILHLLMGCAVFTPYAVPGPNGRAALPLFAWRRWLAGAGLTLLVVLPLAHVAVGTWFRYRTIQAEAWLPARGLAIEDDLPRIGTAGSRLSVDDRPTDGLKVGGRYRVRLSVTNYMLPPEYACCWTDYDRLLKSMDSVQYFYGYIPGLGGRIGTLAVRFTGAQVEAPLRESSLVDAVVRIEAEASNASYPARYWAHVEKAVVVRGPD